MNKLLVISLLFVVFLLLPTTNYQLLTVSAACDPNLGPCPAGLADLSNLVGKIVSVFVGLGFAIMFVMIVWAGFKYLTSGGEPKQIQSAHQVVTWAFLGIIFMAIAWLILQLIEITTGAKVTIFDITSLCGDPSNSKAWFCGK